MTMSIVCPDCYHNFSFNINKLVMIKCYLYTIHFELALIFRFSVFILSEVFIIFFIIISFHNTNTLIWLKWDSSSSSLSAQPDKTVKWKTISCKVFWMLFRRLCQGAADTTCLCAWVCCVCKVVEMWSVFVGFVVGVCYTLTRATAFRKSVTAQYYSCIMLPLFFTYFLMLFFSPQAVFNFVNALLL